MKRPYTRYIVETTSLTFRLPVEDYENLKQLAANNGLNISQQAIDLFLPALHKKFNKMVGKEKK